MRERIQYKPGSFVVWRALLPALVPVLLSAPVAARPLQTIAVRPVASGETAQTLPLERARQLLDKSGGAQALEYRPPLWDWTTPVTVRRVSQATTPAPAATTAQAPSPEDSSDILDEVSVTATRRPVRQRDTTATTYSVKKEDFKAQGAVTATDALQLVPGFIGQPSLGGVRNAGGNFLRGFNDQRFQVLRDGLSLTYSQNGRSSVSQVTVDDLERIEVVTGGATLRYGAGSVGGVINLITETPKGPPKFTLQYEVGSYGFSRYLAKYGGGDDTFSYNFVYSGLVAFNDYPFKFTLPNTARFYGPTVNPDSVTSPIVDPSSYPNETNSFGLPGADPQNNGQTDLYGFLKPEVGPPVTVQGINDSSYNASDSYTAKFTLKPDPVNRLTLRLNQRNNSFDDQGPGTYSLPSCFGGLTASPGTATDNGTLNGDRFLPLNPDGSENTCAQQGFLVNTASVAIAFPFNFNTTYNGQTTFPTGQPYPIAEPASAAILRFQRRNTAQTEISLLHDLDLTPTTSINSYVYYYRNVFNNFRPSPYLLNTNIFGTGNPGDPNFRLPAGNPNQPYSDGNKFEVQSALNAQISPGQQLSLGLNYLQDRVYQQQGGGRRFFDIAISRSSIFLIDDISFSDQLKANIGGRYTYSTQFGGVGTPGVGIRYTPTGFLSVRANGSYVYNAPNIADLAVAGGIFIANPNIQPETGVTYDVGVDLTPARNLGFRLTYFSTYLNGIFGNLVFFNPNVNNPDSANFGVPLVQQVNNLNGRRAVGFEVTADWQPTDQLSFRLAYTNTDVANFGPADNINQASFPNSFGFQDPNVPFNNVAASLTYLNKGLLVALLGRYDSGKRRFSSTDFVPAWATLDLNVELPVTPFLTITGNVFNLTDTQYEFLDGNPAPGMTFRVGARLEIGG